LPSTNGAPDILPNVISSVMVKMVLRIPGVTSETEHWIAEKAPSTFKNQRLA
jgi:hypothetical protein